MLRFCLLAGWQLQENAGASRSDVLSARPLLEVNASTPSTDGKVGRAAAFTGSNNILREQNGAIITAGMDFTVAAWIRRHAGSAVASLCLSQNGAAVRQYIGFNGTTGIPIFAIEGNSQSDGTSMTVNEWYHLAMTYKAETQNMRTFQNGNLLVSRTLAATFSTPTGILIGINNLIADVNEAYVWGKALCDADINLLFKAGMAGRTFPFSDGKGYS